VQVVLFGNRLHSLHVVIDELLCILWRSIAIVATSFPRMGFWHFKDQLGGMFLLALDLNGVIVSTGDIAGGLIDHPFGALETMIFVGIGSCVFGRLAVFEIGMPQILSLDLSGFDQFNGPPMPHVDICLVARTKSRACTRIDTIVII